MLWLVACCILATSDVLLLLVGIVIIALTESVIVLLQVVGVVASKNSFFLCTGSWVNPNVTAMFLAMSLFGLLKLKERSEKKLLLNLSLLGIVSAICLLQCRSAYLAAILFLANYYGQNIKKILSKKWKLLRPSLAATLFALLIIIAAYLLSISFKKESATARVQIWKNSLNLIIKRPATGYGFGLFEKQYNM